VCAVSFAAAYYIPHHSVLLWGVVPILIALSVHVLVNREDWLLNNRAIRYIGVLSYSLYLFQQPFFPQSATINKWSSFPANLPFAVGFALMSFYFS
jgi:peptidoglycan/LPS O-acetylase OafA/YrhL